MPLPRRNEFCGLFGRKQPILAPSASRCGRARPWPQPQMGRGSLSTGGVDRPPRPHRCSPVESAGAWDRRRCEPKTSIFQVLLEERETGFEPATSSLEEIFWGGTGFHQEARNTCKGRCSVTLE